MDNQTIQNKLTGEQITFLESVKDNGGVRSVLKFKVEPKANVPLHYHNSFDEKFEVVDGELSVVTGKTKVKLKKGETATAYKTVRHRYLNESSDVTEFLVTISPGNLHVENMFKIYCGLANDGQSNKQGIPKSPFVMGLMMELGESRLTGWMTLASPLLKWLAGSARKKGIDKILYDKYCK